MAASVEGTFRLIDRASPVLDKIERKALAADKSIDRLGRSLDKVGSPRAEQDMSRLTRKVEESGRTAQRTEVRYRMSMRQLERNVSNATRGATSDVGRLTSALEYLDSVTANPQIELEGEAQAIAMIRVVRGELNKLQREQAKVTLGGIVSGGAAAAGGVVSKISGWMTKIADFPGVVFGKIIGQWGVMLGLLTAALPVIESVVGALGALGATLSSAVVGGAILGTGAITGFITAIGLVAPAAMTAMGSIKEASEAWTAYNEAVEESGRNSKEAREALKVFEETGRAGDIVRQADALKEMYKEMTKPAQRSIFNTIEDTLARVTERWLPDFTRWTNRLFTGGRRRGGIEQAIKEMFEVLEHPTFRDSIDVIVNMLTRATPIVGRTFGFIARTFANIGAAAKPFVLDVLKGIRDFFKDTAQGTDNIKDTRSAMRPFINDLERVWDLLSETAKLLGSLIGAGRGSGRSLITDMTEQVRDWRKSIEEDPGQVEGWFDKMVNRFGKFLDVFKQLVATIKTLNDLVAPLVEKLADLSNMEFGGISGLEALVGYGAYRYIRGRRGAAGGRAPPGGTRGGGTRGGGIPGLPLPIGPRAGGGAPRPAPVPRGQMQLPGMGGAGGGGWARGLPGRLLTGARGIPFLSALFAAGGFANPTGAYADTGMAGRGASALESADPTRLLSLIFPDSKFAQRGLAGTIFRPLAEQVGGPLTAPQAEVMAGAVPQVPFGFARRHGRPVEGLESTMQLTAPSVEDIQSGVYEEGWKEAIRLAEQYEKHQDRIAEKQDKLGDKGFNFAKKLAEDEKPLGEGVARMLDKLHELPKGARKEAADTAIGMAKVLERRGKLPEGTAKALRRSIVNEFENMKVGSVRHSAEMAQGVVSTQRALSDAVHGAMKFIHDATNEGLESLGVDAVKWTVSHPKAVGRIASGGVGGILGAGTAAAAGAVGSLLGGGGGGAGGGGGEGQRGMRIGGHGLQDTVPIAPGHMAAPGELVVNRHTEGRIDRLLNQFGTSLGREVGTEDRPHAAPKRVIERNAARGLRMLQRGGRRPSRRRRGAGGGAGPGRQFENIVQLGQWILSLGDYTVGEHPAFGGVEGGHATNSYHYRGMAIDVNADAAMGGEKAALDRLYAMLQPMGLTELLWQVEDHYDHLHAAMAGPATGAAGAMGAMGGGMMPTPQIGRVKLQGPDTPQSRLAQRAVDKVREGAQRKLEKSNRMMGSTRFAGAAAPGNVRQWLTTALRITGQYSAANLQALIGRAMQESGGDPMAINNWDSNAAAGMPSQGLLQTIPPTFEQYAMRGMNDITNPIHNAVAAIRYMMARYGHIVGPSSGGYATGGRLPFGGWFAEGGAFDANAPMLIGVGEKGKERVEVTPQRAERAGERRGHGVHIERIEIQNHRPGDIQKQMEREISRALDNVSRKLERQGSDDASEVLG